MTPNLAICVGCVKVTCLQENLTRGLQIAGRGVSSRTTLPILGNVLLRTEGRRLKLTATGRTSNLRTPRIGPS